MIRVEVAHALPNEQVILTAFLRPGSTVQEAVEASGILARLPDIDLARCQVGVFGKVVSMTRVLQEGDRVEIYRPLIADPKLLRRARAEQGRTKR